MRFLHLTRISVIGLVALAAITLSSPPAESGHRQVYINGQPVHPQAVLQIERAIGMRLRGGAYRWDGRFLYDHYGNRVPLVMGEPVRRPAVGAGPVRRTGRVTDTVIDSTGGCEGGSCVNILD